MIVSRRLAIANGGAGILGNHAANHVAMEVRPEKEPFLSRQDAAENAQDNLMKQSHAMKGNVQVRSRHNFFFNS